MFGRPHWPTGSSSFFDGDRRNLDAWGDDQISNDYVPQVGGTDLIADADCMGAAIPSGVAWPESDSAPGCGWERLHPRHLVGEPVDILDQHLDHRCRTFVAALQLLDSRGQIFVAGDNF